jgi:Zn-dependent protease
MLTHWWVADAWAISPAFLISWVVWVIGSIVLHELGHGWAAIRCGDPTPIESGHMTWNPFVHMGGAALLMFAIFGFTWGLMPINPSRFRGRYHEALVAAAGPAMNLGLVAVSLLGYGAWVGIARGHWFGPTGIPEHVFANIAIFFRVGVFMNVMGVLFNLVPVPPLDGSRILASVYPSFRRIWEGRGQVLGLVAFAFLFFVGAGKIWGTVFKIGQAAIDAVLRVMVPGAV